jgi:hypothetical protein
MEWGTAILVLGAVAAGVLISAGRPTPHGAGPATTVVGANG